MNDTLTTPPLPGGFAATLAAARAGDETATEILFQAFYPQVQQMVHLALSRDLRRTRPWLSSRFSTGDVVQEVFRGLPKDLNGFQGSTADGFAGYLAMIVRNRLVDAIRHHQADRRDGRLTGEAPEEEPTSPIHCPVEEVIGRDQIRRYRQALEQFSESEVLLLRGRIEQELSFEEIAERLGFSSRFAARRAFFAAQAQLLINMDS